MKIGRSIRATAEEAAKPLPGDRLVADEIGVFTHAVTLPAPPGEVWPWLAQMGAGTRAGWYSYDRLDNGGKRSAWRIIPDSQQIAVGDLFPALPGAEDAFIIVAVEQAKTLVLGVPGPAGRYLARWTFALEGLEGGRTRLLVRASLGYTIWDLPRPVMRAVARAVHFIMERKQLQGIRQRVARAAAEHGHPVGRERGVPKAGVLPRRR